MARTSAEKSKKKRMFDNEYELAKAAYPDPQTTASMAFAMLCRDPDADSQIRSSWMSHIEFHHLMGRTHSKANYRCNLIPLFASTHHYATHNKMKTEVAFLMVQYQLQKRHDDNVQIGFALPLEDHNRYWNPSVLANIAYRDSLEGRIEVDLLPVVMGTPLEAIAIQLLENIESDKTAGV